MTFVPVTDVQDARSRLDQGDVDLLAGTWVHTREAELEYDFSIPILDDGMGVCLSQRRRSPNWTN